MQYTAFLVCSIYLNFIFLNMESIRLFLTLLKHKGQVTKSKPVNRPVKINYN